MSAPVAVDTDKSYWNYRIVEKTGLFFVAEVYYNDNGIEAWSHIDGDWALNILAGWDDLEDLKGAAEQVIHAFHLPVLRWTDAGGKEQLIGVV